MKAVKKHPDEFTYMKDFSDFVCPNCGSEKITVNVSNPNIYFCKKCGRGFKKEKQEEKKVQRKHRRGKNPRR